jgi:hypothetical protein
MPSEPHIYRQLVENQLNQQKYLYLLEGCGMYKYRLSLTQLVASTMSSIHNLPCDWRMNNRKTRKEKATPPSDQQAVLISGP